MKKVALSLMALAVVAAGAFADAPKWDPKASTDFKGEATVTLGYDLDTGISAFKNGTSVSLIIDLVSGGTAATKSDSDVWGEIAIKTDGDPVRIKADGLATDSTTAYDNGFKLQVDYATIHFGKAAYAKITSYDTTIGYANSPDVAYLGHLFSNQYKTTADASKKIFATGSEVKVTGVSYVDATGTTVDQSAKAVGAVIGLTAGAVYTKTTADVGTINGVRYGHDNGTFLQSAFESQGPTAAGGLEIGYSLEKVASVSVIVGSVAEWNTALINIGSKTNIAYKGTVGLLAVDNLTLEGGYSSSTIENTAKALGAKVAYNYAIDGEKLYVKPSVGYTQSTPAGEKAKAFNLASAGVLLGTGAKAAAFDNYGMELDSDYGSYPGLAFGVFYSDEAKVAKDSKKAAIGLNVSANSGALSPDVTVLAAYEVKDLNAEDKASLISLGAAGTLKAGDITFAPKGIVEAYSEKDGVIFYKKEVQDTASSSLFIKGTVDVTGVIPFVTFTVNYESNDLSNGYWDTNDKLGKLELTTKVSF